MSAPPSVSSLAKDNGVCFRWKSRFRFIEKVVGELLLRRRPLYPTELRGLIQKIFNFTGFQDSNDSIFRRRTLYPGEVRGHIQNLFNYTRLRDSNGSIVRRRSLYTTELQGRVNFYAHSFSKQRLHAHGVGSAVLLRRRQPKYYI